MAQSSSMLAMSGIAVADAPPVVPPAVPLIELSAVLPVVLEVAVLSVPVVADPEAAVSVLVPPVAAVPPLALSVLVVPVPVVAPPVVPVPVVPPALAYCWQSLRS